MIRRPATVSIVFASTNVSSSLALFIHCIAVFVFASICAAAELDVRMALEAFKLAIGTILYTTFPPL
jgi:hypothetical protein